MNAIQRVLPMDVYYPLRFTKQFLKQEKLKEEPDCTRRVIWYLDAPDYGNLGDEAIAYATIKFINETLPDAQLIEIQKSNVIRYMKDLKRKIHKEDLIVLQGGGNIGDLYPRYEWVRRTIIKNFPNNKIVVFPQTTYFTNSRIGRWELRMSNKVYKSHRDLTIFARECRSQSAMEKAFPGVKILLAPDIVLYLKGIVKGTHKKGQAVCMRDDKEKTPHDVPAGMIQANSERISTTIECSRPVIGELRETEVLGLLTRFGEYSQIVTDRLHGMIFAYLAGTPCIAFDSQTGKSKAVYESWLQGCPYITIKSNDIYNSSDPSKLARSIDFSELERAIK